MQAGYDMNREWQEANKHVDLEKVRALINEGVEVNSKDEHGQTALMNAAHAGQVELVRLLIELGADLNVTAKYSLSALMLSLIANHTDVARLLIEAGADINILGSGSFIGRSALTLADNGGHSEIAALLQQKGTIGQR
jgi:ankyrin repeat protein